MRNFFDPVDYCCDCQTKSLLSCWSRDLHSSTLPDLAEKITSKGIFSLKRNDDTLSQLISKRSKRIIQQASFNSFG